MLLKCIGRDRKESGDFKKLVTNDHILNFTMKLFLYQIRVFGLFLSLFKDTPLPSP